MSFATYKMESGIFSQPKWGLEFRTTWNHTVAIASDFYSPDLMMWKRDPGHIGNQFIFASPHFEFATKNTEVFDRAAALKAMLDGALYLCCDRHDPFTFTKLVDNSTDKEHDYWDGNVLTNPFHPTVVVSKTPRVLDPGKRFGPEHMLFLARYDDVTKNLLKHLGFNGPDFRTLYSLLDWLRTHGWKDDARVAACSGMNAGDVKRFTGTVNNVAVLGPLARHGDKNWNVPIDTISLQDAQKLILRATYSFLKDRAEEIDVIAKWKAIEGD